MKNIFTVIALAACMNTTAQTCFTTTSYPVGGATTTIAVADFNNDGHLDIVASDEGGPGASVYMLPGTGTGTFGTAILAVDAGDSLFTVSARSIVSADFNTDGNADLAVATYYEVTVLFGDGAGYFTTPSDFTVGSYPEGICSADFNGDGDMDIASSNDGTVSILLGNGAGSFSSHVDFAAGNDMNAIATGDFNGDGDLDLAATSNANGGAADSVWVLLGNGLGSFGTATKYLAAEGPYSVCTIDFNDDGFDDIAVANTNSQNVSVFLSQGVSGIFSPAENFTTLHTPFSIVSADFNVDGIPDLATGAQGNDVSILLGSDSAYFGAPSLFSCPGFPWEIATGDFNEDGRPDLAAASHDASSVKVLLNVEVVNCTGCALNNGVTVPNICMVSTDSATAYQYNVIIWDNSLYTNVDSFIVYRKDALTSTYLRIGATSKDSLSLFVDTQFNIGGPNGGNPMYSSWFYKLAIRDTCGNIGEKSPYHQTMFFQQNDANFSWNAYTVESGQTNPVTGYSLLRDDNNSGTWNVLVNTVGLSSTDPDYSTYPNGNWRIDALGFSCTPTNKTYMISQSNPIKPIVAGIEHFILNKRVKIYPNPSSGVMVITSEINKGTYNLHDITGKTLLQGTVSTTKFSLDISSLSSGVYFVSVSDGERQVNGKVVKE
jgi:hypothetical protein